MGNNRVGVERGGVAPRVVIPSPGLADVEFVDDASGGHGTPAESEVEGTEFRAGVVTVALTGEDDGFDFVVSERGDGEVAVAERARQAYGGLDGGAGGGQSAPFRVGLMPPKPDADGGKEEHEKFFHRAGSRASGSGGKQGQGNEDREVIGADVGADPVVGDGEGWRDEAMIERDTQPPRGDRPGGAESASGVDEVAFTKQCAESRGPWCAVKVAEDDHRRRGRRGPLGDGLEVQVAQEEVAGVAGRKRVSGEKGDGAVTERERGTDGGDFGGAEVNRFGVHQWQAGKKRDAEIVGPRHAVRMRVGVRKRGHRGNPLGVHFEEGDDVGLLVFDQSEKGGVISVVGEDVYEEELEGGCLGVCGDGGGGVRHEARREHGGVEDRERGEECGGAETAGDGIDDGAGEERGGVVRAEVGGEFEQPVAITGEGGEREQA